MKIQAIIPNIQNQNQAKRNLLNNSHVIQPKYSNSLVQDTVSFGHAAKISDFLTDSVTKNIDRMERIATTYLDVLESVALKLKDNGVSFDRLYCEANAVKSPKSYTSKVVRSKNFTVPDAIRATLYMNDSYDLSILNEKLLPEMQKRGYVLADAETTVKSLIKRGYIPTAEELQNESAKILVPDLDIRLEDVSEQVSKLTPKLKYSIGKPQKSGYEDIQMRFIRTFDKKRNPIQHELIILFGPEYAKAKHIESEKVYSYLRKFDELNMKFEDKTIGSNSLRAHRYIELIKQMFRGKISEKLFLNAKNKDLYDINEEIPIYFSQADIERFSNYFSGLKNRIGICYKEAKTKGSQSKTVLKQLTANQRQDRDVLSKIKKGLDSTIDYFNNLHGLKQTE